MKDSILVYNDLTGLTVFVLDEDKECTRAFRWEDAMGNLFALITKQNFENIPNTEEFEGLKQYYNEGEFDSKDCIASFCKFQQRVSYYPALMSADAFMACGVR